MVITDNTLDQLPPAERIKKLNALKKKQEEELETFKKEKEQELSDTVTKIEESVEELAQEDEQATTLINAPLEETLLAQEATDDTLELLLPQTFIELTNYNLYGSIKRIEDKGYSTPEEQRQLQQLQQQLQQLTSLYSTDHRQTIDATRGNYASRTEELLKRLNKRTHDLSEGLYDLNKRDFDAIYE